MPTAWLGFGIGTLFGAALFLSGLADPDKIIGTLRLKDFHALRVVIVFVVVGMVGVWLLQIFGLAHLSIKPTLLWSVLLGGALLGIGFGMTGYCPGTGLACAATGRLDAVASVLGMFAGALTYIVIYPRVAQALEQIANYGKLTLPDSTGITALFWVLLFTGVAIVVLYKTRKHI